MISTEAIGLTLIIAGVAILAPARCPHGKDPRACWMIDVPVSLQ